MKITRQPGVGFEPLPRITEGMYIYIRNDQLIVAKRPNQPYDDTYCGQFYRDQMRYSAGIMAYAIPQEVSGAMAWQVNSNDTWKDALTRAQFGTLFRVWLKDGTEYHPADHSCTMPVPEEDGEMPWTVVKLWEHSVSGNTLQVEYIVEEGYTEFFFMLDNVSRAASDWIVVRCSTDGGASYPSGVGTYIDINSVGVQSTIGAFFFPANFTTAGTGGNGWVIGANIGNKWTSWFSSFSATGTARFIANNDPVNAFKVGPTNLATNMTGGRILILAK